MSLSGLDMTFFLLSSYGVVVNVIVACDENGTFPHPPYNPLTFVVIVTVYRVLFARLLFGSMTTVVPFVANDIVVATGPGVSVMLVAFKVVGSIAREKVTLIVLLMATPVTVFAGSEDDITNAGTFEAHLVSASTD